MPKRKTINALRRVSQHAEFLRELEMQANHGYQLVTTRLIEAVLNLLRAEKLIKSDDGEIDLPHIPKPVIEVDVWDTVNATINKYLEAMRYMMLGGEAGDETLKIVEGLRLKTKIPSGGVFESYLDSTDAHREHFEAVTGMAPGELSPLRKKTYQFMKDRAGRHVDQSIGDLRNRLLNQLTVGLEETATEQQKAAREAAIARLQDQDMNLKERRALVKEVLEDAVKERGSLQAARQALRDVTRNYEVNFDRIIHTEYSMASNTAAAETIMETAGKISVDPIVVILDKDDHRETPFCREHSRDEEGGLLYWRLSSLAAPGTNLSRKKADWINSIPLRHHGCRCILVYVPDGFKVDHLGSLIPLEEGEVLKIEK